jgi:hypothetical protein
MALIINPYDRSALFRPSLRQSADDAELLLLHVLQSQLDWNGKVINPYARRVSARPPLRSDFYKAGNVGSDNNYRGNDYAPAHDKEVCYNYVCKNDAVACYNTVSNNSLSSLSSDGTVVPGMQFEGKVVPAMQIEGAEEATAVTRIIPYDTLTEILIVVRPWDVPLPNPTWLVLIPLTRGGSD